MSSIAYASEARNAADPRHCRCRWCGGIACLLGRGALPAGWQAERDHILNAAVKRASRWGAAVPASLQREYADLCDAVAAYWERRQDDEDAAHFAALVRMAPLDCEPPSLNDGQPWGGVDGGYAGRVA